MVCVSLKLTQPWRYWQYQTWNINLQGLLVDLHMPAQDLSTTQTLSATQDLSIGQPSSGDSVIFGPPCEPVESGLTLTLSSNACLAGLTMNWLTLCSSVCKNIARKAAKGVFMDANETQSKKSKARLEHSSGFGHSSARQWRQCCLLSATGLGLAAMVILHPLSLLAGVLGSASGQWEGLVQIPTNFHSEPLILPCVL